MTYLLDTSAWVAYLRQHGTPEAVRVRELVRDSADDLVGCSAVRMELAVDPQELRRRRLLRWYDGFADAGVHADDFDVAASIFRAGQVRWTHDPIDDRLPDRGRSAEV